MRKKIVIFSTVIILAVLGSYLYLKYRKLDDFEPKLKEKLQQLVAKGSRGLYRIEVAKINADVVNSRLILSDIHVSYDSLVYAKMQQSNTAPPNVFELRLNALAIDGITPDDLIRKKDIRLDVLYADHPVIHLYHLSEPKGQKAKDSSSVYELIRDEIGSFGLKKLTLKNLDFTYHKKGDKVQTSFKDLMVDLDDILIDENTQRDTTRFLYAKDAAISLKDFVHKTADSIYNFKLDSISINAAKNKVRIRQLKLEPRAGKAAFRKLVKKRKDRYNISINNLALDDIDWWRFIEGNGLFISDARIANGKIEVYSDKGIPAGNEKKLGNYPHQNLFKLDMPLYVKKIDVQNLDITYSELNIKTGREGDILFWNTNATISNITNIDSRISENGLLKIDAVSKFMKQGTLKAGFRFNLARQKEGIFSVYADLQDMDGTALNKATVPLGSVEIKQAHISRFKADIEGDNYKAKGAIFLTYQDLKINALKKDDDGKLKKRGLLSFIANTFKVNDNYPKKGDDAKTFHSTYKRPLQKSFFALIWKTIFFGLKEPVGI